jgi:hypothetical protein
MWRHTILQIRRMVVDCKKMIFLSVTFRFLLVEIQNGGGWWGCTWTYKKRRQINFCLCHSNRHSLSVPLKQTLQRTSETVRFINQFNALDLWNAFVLFLTFALETSSLFRMPFTTQHLLSRMLSNDTNTIYLAHLTPLYQLQCIVTMGSFNWLKC